MGKRSAQATEPKRRFIGVHFTCCGAYTRFYRKPEDREYRGRCPRCLKTLQVGVAESGVATTTLRASCR